ncbi:NAD(P)-binding domain-containing protein [Fluviicola sp.]|uniref:NADPH-dependent F420 reductase n=1 Tax=Fluviicola sp. TaxID=1917219 RepID=UPI0031D28910
MNYTIGIIGAGHIGQALATHLSKTNYRVLISNRKGAESLQEVVASIGGSLKAADLKQTVEEADMLFLAIPWGGHEAFAKYLEGHTGKIIVDATNNIVSMFPLRVTDLKGKTTGEYVSQLYPGQHVVKAFNTLPYFILAKNPVNSGSEGNRVIVMSGDYAAAKATVVELAGMMGFATIDIGTLKEGKLQDPGGALSNVELIKMKANY